MKWTEVFDKQAYDEVLESLKASAQVVYTTKYRFIMRINDHDHQ